MGNKIRDLYWRWMEETGNQEFENYFDRMRIARYSFRMDRYSLRASTSRYLFGDRKKIWRFIKKRYGKVFMRNMLGIGVNQDEWVTSTRKFGWREREVEARSEASWRLFKIAERCYRETRPIQDNGIESSSGGDSVE